MTGSDNGAAFDCPGSCSALVLQNSDLVLTATPDEGAEFTTWGGSCEQYGSDPTCTIVISGPKDVTAGFGNPPPPTPMFTLTVAKSGSGTGYVGGAGGIDCGPTCSATLPQGAKMTLLAVADEGSTFAGWSGGACSGTGMCSVTFAADMRVTATFSHLDRTAPHFRTIRASAAPGTTVDLRFRVFDDSGESRELLTIVQGRVTIARIAVPLRPRPLRAHVHGALARPARPEAGAEELLRDRDRQGREPQHALLLRVQDHVMRRLVAIALAAAAVAGLAGQAARADGDPASDVLYFQDVFLPYAKPSADAAAKLTATVASANKAGFRIKVAVIASEQDLGSVPSLFNRQDVYAHFLGVELKTFYTQRLLVVMPAGFGDLRQRQADRARRRRRWPGSRSPRRIRRV